VIRSVCVFCGSSAGDDPAFAAAARALGGAVARSGRRLVYGGGRVGLMGVLADAALARGAAVVGVIPSALARKEVAHPSLSELRVVGSMHERKATMAELADAFVALPGGLGTLEELFEVWTWGQLGLHSKPVGILGVADFFAPLLAFLDGLVARGFVRRQHRDMLVLDDDPERLLARLDQACAHMAPTPRWIAPGQE
jgi:uncharacterized protein (TIGR00730 family)